MLSMQQHFIRDQAARPGPDEFGGLWRSVVSLFSGILRPIGGKKSYDYKELSI